MALPNWINPVAWLTSLFQAKYIKVIVRKLVDLTAAGLLAIGVSRGATDQLIPGLETTLTELLSILAILITTSWSLVEKKK